MPLPITTNDRHPSQVALGSSDVHHLEHIVHSGFDEALVFLYTPDNRPPPTADDVERYWHAVQHQFPNAE